MNSAITKLRRLEVLFLNYRTTEFLKNRYKIICDQYLSCGTTVNVKTPTCKVLYPRQISA